MKEEAVHDAKEQRTGNDGRHSGRGSRVAEQVEHGEEWIGGAPLPQGPRHASLIPAGFFIEARGN